jgi:hypothetical protein
LRIGIFSIGFVVSIRTFVAVPSVLVITLAYRSFFTGSSQRIKFVSGKVPRRARDILVDPGEPDPPEPEELVDQLLRSDGGLTPFVLVER